MTPPDDVVTQQIYSYLEAKSTLGEIPSYLSEQDDVRLVKLFK